MKRLGEFVILIVYGVLVGVCISSGNLTGLTVLFACFLAYVGFNRLSLLQQPRAIGIPDESQQGFHGLPIQQQLRNLYMLLFWIHKVEADSLSPLAEDPSEWLSAGEAGNRLRLEAWEARTFHHFLASGFRPEDAVSAFDTTREKYAKYIAELAPDRIRNACKASGLYGPCGDCAKAIEAAKTRLSEIAKQENQGKKFGYFDYRLVEPRCPLPEREDSSVGKTAPE